MVELKTVASLLSGTKPHLFLFRFSSRDLLKASEMCML